MYMSETFLSTSPLKHYWQSRTHMVRKFPTLKPLKLLPPCWSDLHLHDGATELFLSPLQVIKVLCSAPMCEKIIVKHNPHCGLLLSSRDVFDHIDFILQVFPSEERLLFINQYKFNYFINALNQCSTKQSLHKVVTGSPCFLAKCLENGQFNLPLIFAWRVSLTGFGITTEIHENGSLPRKR